MHSGVLTLLVTRLAARSARSCLASDFTRFGDRICALIRGLWTPRDLRCHPGRRTASRLILVLSGLWLLSSRAENPGAKGGVAAVTSVDAH